MVRAAVSASQASLERPGSAPAPFSTCPQAEPRPEAQAHAARVQGSTQDGSRGDTGKRVRRAASEGYERVTAWGAPP